MKSATVPGSVGRKRTWTVAIIAALLMAAVLIAGHQSFRSTQRLSEDDFNQRQLVLAQYAASGIELSFESVAASLRTIAVEPDVASLDEQTVRWNIGHGLTELAHFGVNDIGVLDEHGIVRFTASAHQLEGIDFSWREYFREARELENGDAYVAEFITFQGVDAGRQGVLVAVPIHRPHTTPIESFVGVMVATLALDAITDQFLVPIQPSARGHALLVDGDGEALWLPDATRLGLDLRETNARFPEFGETLERMVAGGEGSAEVDYLAFDEAAGIYTEESEVLLLAYAPVEIGRELWSVGVWAPRSDARERSRSAYRKHLSLVALVVLIMMLGTTYVVAWSARYNRELQREIRVKTREIEGSHERLSTVLDSLQEIVFVCDIETSEILLANQYLRDRARGRELQYCWQAVEEGQSDLCDNCNRERLQGAGGEHAGVATRERHDSASKRWYEIRDRAIRWDDGRLVRLEIAIDITERKRAEEERLALERKVQQARKLESLGVLAGGVAHDFDNLLVGILVNADLVLDSLDNGGEVRERVEAIKQAGRRASELTKQLLVFSGKGQLVMAPVDLAELASEVCRLLDSRIPDTITIRHEFDGELPAVEGDGTQIRQVLMNLITNAADAIGEANGEIVVRAYRVGESELGELAEMIEAPSPHGFVHLEVSDTGIGMDDETSQQIFEPFFTTKFTGRGLGLAAVAGNVRSHGGAVEVESELGRGTTFHLWFPVSAGEAVPDLPSGKVDLSAWTGDGTILLVDDEVMVSEVMGTTLEGAGFDVLLAGNGREAVEVFQEHRDRIVCVVMDLGMPEMDGEDCFREIRALCGDVPVIVSSAYNEQALDNEAMRAGIAGYLKKPFGGRELVEAVRDALDSSPS